MKPDFSKTADGLLPVIVQDDRTAIVLMLGYMNEEAWNKTLETQQVTFYSRSRQALWTKGETSGNFLRVRNILTDCDHDTLLIRAIPAGPVCHTGADTCFGENNPGFSLHELEAIIDQRKDDPVEQSYTARLFGKGINKIAQKLGEEAVELVIESKDDNRELFLGESADLLYHFLVLLRAKKVTLQEVEKILGERHRKASA